MQLTIHCCVALAYDCVHNLQLHDLVCRKAIVGNGM